MKKAAEFESDELKLHQSLDQHVARVLKGKRLLLFKHLLEISEYNDSELFNDMIKGFDLVGHTSTSGCLQKKIRPATTSPSDL